MQSDTQDGLVPLAPDQLQVTAKGWTLVRAIAMVFDRYWHEPPGGIVGSSGSSCPLCCYSCAAQLWMLVARPDARMRLKQIVLKHVARPAGFAAGPVGLHGCPV